MTEQHCLGVSRGGEKLGSSRKRTNESMKDAEQKKSCLESILMTKEELTKGQCVECGQP